MPSRYEPCGLTQLYAMAYGTLPIVHATGGLVDTVVADNENEKEATGVVFPILSEKEFAGALEHSIQLYSRKRRLNAIRKRGMLQNYGWGKSAKKYLEVYKKAIAGN